MEFQLLAHAGPNRVALLDVLQEVLYARLADWEEPLQFVVLVLVQLDLLGLGGEGHLVVGGRVVGGGPAHRVDAQVDLLVGQLFEPRLAGTDLGDLLVDVGWAGVVDGLSGEGGTASCWRRESARSCLGAITSWPLISWSRAAILSSSITDIYYTPITP